MRNSYTIYIYFPLANLVRDSRGHVTSYVIQPPDFLLALYKGDRESQHSLFSVNIIVKLLYYFLPFIIIFHCQLAYIAMSNHELKDILKVLFLYIITLLDNESSIIALKDNIKGKAHKIPVFK